ncbi:hypothetical protein MRX96_015505 [Rhipicephalus microplus]
MLKYDYQLQHVPGKKMMIADMFLRIQGQEWPGHFPEDIEVHAISILPDRVNPKTIAELAEAELQIVIKKLEASQPFEGELKSVGGVDIAGSVENGGCVPSQFVVALSLLLQLRRPAFQIFEALIHGRKLVIDRGILCFPFGIRLIQPNEERLKQSLCLAG